MQEGPVDLAAPSNPEAVIKPELTQPVRPHPIPQMMIMPTPGRLNAKHQIVLVCNTDPAQTHVIVDRHYNGVEIAPGQKVEIDMLVEDIASFQKLARPDRGVYMSGHLVGRPLPPHPVRILNIPDQPVQEGDVDLEALASAAIAAASASAVETATTNAAVAAAEAESRRPHRR
jgi:hypothetical protein